MDDDGKRARYSPMRWALLLAFAWVGAMTGFPLAKMLVTGGALSESEQGNLRMGAIGLAILVLAIVARLIWRRIGTPREPRGRNL